MDEPIDLIETAKTVLEQNREGMYTVPSRTLYPHQWLWDSCFTAIGLRHYDIDRAQNEILSLLKGQWHNGMLPNIIFNSVDGNYKRDIDIWRSWLNPNSPDEVSTSGITQPPMLAEAIVRIGDKLSVSERHTWYKTVLPSLIKYHEWLYSDRDPHGEGLVLLIHPWECGMDNTPPWMAELQRHLLPFWVRLIGKLRLNKLVEIFRRDTKHVPVSERLSTEEALGLYSVQRRLRRKHYEIDKILPHGLFAIEDLMYNCIFIRANHLLRQIAKNVQYKLPEPLLASMRRTEIALEELWDPNTNQYYSRDFITHELLKEPSIASLMPLYTGIIDEDRAKKLVKLLESKHLYGPTYPVPSVPVNSEWFYEKGYWQGATWVNTNWLLIDGLSRMGFQNHAEALKEATIELVSKSDMHEYFSPINGEPAGSGKFSWTAALFIDLSSD
jgi:hypothetical protein